MAREEVQTVCDALGRGLLTAQSLGARSIAKLLGRTTGLLYHHWGSLDGFLLEVAHLGWQRLATDLAPKAQGPLADLAEGYLQFAFDHPALYHLMAERRLDWARLRAEGRLSQGASLDMWDAVAARLEDAGSTNPSEDARLLYAGLHGLASLALSGRANVRDIDATDQEVAVRAARHLVDRLTPSTQET